MVVHTQVCGRGWWSLNTLSRAAGLVGAAAWQGGAAPARRCHMRPGLGRRTSCQPPHSWPCRPARRRRTGQRMRPSRRAWRRRWSPLACGVGVQKCGWVQGCGRLAGGRAAGGGCRRRRRAAPPRSRSLATAALPAVLHHRLGAGTCSEGWAGEGAVGSKALEPNGRPWLLQGSAPALQLLTSGQQGAQGAQEGQGLTAHSGSLKELGGTCAGRSMCRAWRQRRRC